MYNSLMLADVATTASQAATVSTGVWLGFIGLLIVLLLVDLKLVMRKPHQINTREAAIYSVIWITLGVLFAGVIWQMTSSKK